MTKSIDVNVFRVSGDICMMVGMVVVRVPSVAVIRFLCESMTPLGLPVVPPVAPAAAT